MHQPTSVEFDAKKIVLLEFFHYRFLIYSNPAEYKIRYLINTN